MSPLRPGISTQERYKEKKRPGRRECREKSACPCRHVTNKPRRWRGMPCLTRATRWFRGSPTRTKQYRNSKRQRRLRGLTEIRIRPRDQIYWLQGVVSKWSSFFTTLKLLKTIWTTQILWANNDHFSFKDHLDKAYMNHLANLSTDHLDTLPEAHLYRL